MLLSRLYYVQVNECSTDNEVNLVCYYYFIGIDRAGRNDQHGAKFRQLITTIDEVDTQNNFQNNTLMTFKSKLRGGMEADAIPPQSNDKEWIKSKMNEAYGENIICNVTQIF